MSPIPRWSPAGIAPGNAVGEIVGIDRHRAGVPRAVPERDEPTPYVVARITEIRDVEIVQVPSHAKTGRPYRIGGQPPDDLARYPDLVHALRDLLRRCRLSQRDVVRRDLTGVLRRSTVGAVLRGERPARRDVVIAIVRACGLGETVVAAWEAAWLRLGQPYLEARREEWRENALPNLFRATYGRQHRAMHRWR
jgi:hypothetical protein